MSLERNSKNFDLFRDCLSGPLAQRLAPTSTKASRKRKSKGRRNKIKHVQAEAASSDVLPSQDEDVGEFIDVRQSRGCSFES